MKTIISALFISIFFLACQSVPPSYYYSNAHINKIINTNETKLKVIPYQFENIFDNFNSKNEIGVIVGKDNLDGKTINYLLICPKIYDYEVNQGVAININQVKDLISAINKALENSKLEKINESEFYINFSVTPESSIQQINKDYVSKKTALEFRYERKKNLVSSDFVINDRIYYFNNDLDKIKKLFEKGYEELMWLK